MAGGATAQCLGLMSAIYVGNKLNKPFKITYFPYSTGTYWPFAINFLLDKNEIITTEKNNIGNNNIDNLEIGKIITTHPLFKKRISYEHVLAIVRKFHLLTFLLFLRRELALRKNLNSLLKINHFYRTISGNFPMINDVLVNSELDRRFKKANIQSPFSKNNDQKFQNCIVIHYRLGDKRARFEIPSDFTDDGIIDPIYYKKILDDIKEENNKNIFVVSDEPKVALRLLESVGISANVDSIQNKIWHDLYIMSQAQIFIGGVNSQVAQLASICNVNNGGKAFLLVPKKLKFYTENNHAIFYDCDFLDRHNSIYKLDFKLDNDSHTSYKYFQ